MKNNPSKRSKQTKAVELNSSPSASQLSTITRFISEADANDALKQIKTTKDGRILFERYNLVTRILHLVLMVTITVLAFTGLVQINHGSNFGQSMLNLVHRLNNLQEIHHAFAILLALLAIIHLVEIMEKYVVRRQHASMVPVSYDFRSFLQMQRFNLGISKDKPRFDRYSLEEKAVYWLAGSAIVILGLTGVFQWFPLLVTEFLPGKVVPIAGIIHRWEAILLMIVIFVWHLYQMLISRTDFSIFSGLKSKEEMQKEHSLELEYIEKAAAAVGSPTWPVKIELALVNDPDSRIVKSESTK